MITYEGYGPSGVAVIVETMTDNRNRTAGDMRHYFDKFGGNLGQTGAVSWQFDRKGVIVVEAGEKSEDDVMMDALSAGAEDFSVGEEIYEIYTDPDQFSSVRDALSDMGYAFLEAEVEMLPQNRILYVYLFDIKNMNKLLDALEENDDVQNVWHNWDE